MAANDIITYIVPLTLEILKLNTGYVSDQALGKVTTSCQILCVDEDENPW